MGSEDSRQAMVARALARGLEVAGTLGRQVRRLERFLEGAALAALDERGRSELNRVLYIRRTGGDYHGSEGLRPWERRWLDEDLPPAPASILVGGAGSGREVRSLLERGYRVIAFEPVDRFVERARTTLAPGAPWELFQGGYESILDGQGGLASELATRAPFDAVLLGYNSLMHIDAAERLPVLRELGRLCPAGPLLLSVWLRPEGGGRRPDRAFTWGLAFGQRLGRAAQVRASESVAAATGYVSYFTVDELGELARAIGRHLTVRGSPGDAPHFTLSPAPDSG